MDIPPPDKPVAQAEAHRTDLITLVFTDIVGSTSLKHQLGDRAGVSVIQRHHAMLRETLARFPAGKEVETAGDSFLIAFGTPSAAVGFALELQTRIRGFSTGGNVPLKERIGIHLGEVVVQDHSQGVKPRDLYGIQVDICARVMSLAEGGQILLTRSVFDSARQMLKGGDLPTVGQLSWRNHGLYEIKGLQEPIEICEVGYAGREVLTAPANSDKARRKGSAGAATGSGARPATDHAVPHTQRASKRELSSPHEPGETEKVDLSRMRHELRTPINHILGYCELLMEEGQIPEEHRPDLRRIHTGGRELQALIARYFDEEQFFQQRDLHQLYHELRTPVNHIIGYSDLLIEEAENGNMQSAIPDLNKIRDAAANWLALMEAYLVDPAFSTADAPTDPSVNSPQAIALNLGFSFKAPEPKSADSDFRDEGAILVVDDDDSSREMLARRLRRCGYTVSAVPGGVRALALARSQKFDLIMLDMIMPGLDGFQVLAKFKSDPQLRDTPVIMLSALDEENGIARCIEMGAEDYLAKPFNPIFLRARIGACLEKKRLRDRERTTYDALLQSQKNLAAELGQAAAHARSLLPAPLEGEVRARWRFLPSAELGGNLFGYHWIDSRRLAIYLLDVAGHGIGAALRSISVLNLLRAQSLPGTNFADPAAVLKQLNCMYPIDRNGNVAFTLWYGVFDLAKRQLTYSSAGHPPAVLTGTSSGSAQQLTTGGSALASDPAAEFRNGSCEVRPGSRLYIFSTGAYQISRPDGGTTQLADFIQQLDAADSARGSKLDALVEWARNARGQSPLQDDLSLLELEF